MAELLSGNSYTTAFFGKWHLNQHHNGYLGWSPTHGPRQQGFGLAVEDFGSHPYRYRAQKEQATAITTAGLFPKDTLVESCVDFLRRNHHQPFFAMMSHFYVHTPVATDCQWLLRKYEAKVPADSPNREKRVAYGTFVEMLDHYTGQLLLALEQSGCSDSTIVVFTSDNGGHPEYVANGPLRGSKWNLYEGGTRVPFLVRWPGTVTPQSICSSPVISYDLLPTFAEAAGCAPGTLTADLDGLSLVPFLRGDGRQPQRSLVWHFPYYHPEHDYEKALKTIGVDDFAVSQTRPHSAIRRQNAKLIYFFEEDECQLFDLSADVSELAEIAGTQVEKTRLLKQELDAYLHRVEARLPAK